MASKCVERSQDFRKKEFLSEIRGMDALASGEVGRRGYGSGKAASVLYFQVSGNEDLKCSGTAGQHEEKRGEYGASHIKRCTVVWCAFLLDIFERGRRQNY